MMSIALHLLWYVLLWTLVSVGVGLLLGHMMDDGEERGAGRVGDTGPAPAGGRATM
jgi:hypothetical protein